MVCRARLSWRSPPRLSRWRVVWPDDAGRGQTPARAAKAASLRIRPWWDQAREIAAADRSDSRFGEQMRHLADEDPFQLGLEFVGFLLAGECTPRTGPHRPDRGLVLDWPGGSPAGPGRPCGGVGGGGAPRTGAG